jgi:phospholipid/cholesterol/gamma-HCH transport system substrate-binding protein
MPSGARRGTLRVMGGGIAGTQRRPDFVVGLVLLAAVGVGGGGMATAAFHRAADDYRLTADFPTVSGLSAGAVVRLAGVPIGEVRSTSLRGEHAHVVLDIDSAMRLPTDSTAAIKGSGLVGERGLARFLEKLS